MANPGKSNMPWEIGARRWHAYPAAYLLTPTSFGRRGAPKRPTCVTRLFPMIFILCRGAGVESCRFFGRAAKRELYF
jgi:hypothetical protein